MAGSPERCGLAPLSFAEGSMGALSCTFDAVREGMGLVRPADVLRYGDPRGTMELRERIAELHSTDSLPFSAANVRVTSSAQQSLQISFAFLRELLPEATVFMQEPAYFGAVRLLGKNLAGWTVETFGSVAGLVPRIERQPPGRGEVVYLTSNFQTPSGLSVPDDEKAALAAAVGARGECWVVEDNPYDLLYFQGERQPKSLLDWPAARTRVLHVGSLSKMLGPGLRVGYMLGAEGTVGHRGLHAAKIDADLFTSTLGQRVAAGALSVPYLRRLRYALKSRLDAALASLSLHLGPARAAGRAAWEAPGGGIFINIQFPGLDAEGTERLQRITLDSYALTLEPSKYMYRGCRTRAETRVNFADLAPPEFAEGVRRLAAALRDLSESSPRAASPAAKRRRGEEAAAARQLRVVVSWGAPGVGLGGGNWLSAEAPPQHTGARITEELLRRGHSVTFLRCSGAGPAAPDGGSAGLESRHCPDAQSYALALREALQGRPDAAVLGAAEPTLVPDGAGFKQCPPAMLSTAKQLCATAFLVGFQRLARDSVSELVDAAYRESVRTRCNLTVACGQGGEGRREATLLITPEKGISPTDEAGLPAALAHALETRVSRRHYKTEVATAGEHLRRPEVAVLRQLAEKGFRLQLFCPYLMGERMDFGFIAVRSADGSFLITARASDKERVPDEDICLVTSVDESSRLVKVVSSTGKKASLNAPVAARIFRTRPEVKVVLHAHVFPGCENRCGDFSPGTQEDVDEVCRFLSNGEPIVEIADHGIVAVGANGDECIRAVGRSHAYHKYAPLYDLLYSRFLRSTDFVDLVASKVPRGAKLLDCAAGTGEVSRELLGRGFSDISLADASGDMLRVATAKLAPLVPGLRSWALPFHELGAIGDTFDAVVIRQAINYAMDLPGLATAMRSIRSVLRPGGQLLFNSTNFKESAEASYPQKVHSAQVGELEVAVSEGNDLVGRELWHAQRCTVSGLRGDDFFLQQVYDCNVFGMFTAEEFAETAKGAGFSQVELLGKGCQPLTDGSRSLYVVATN
eukprot:TRINITY_DN36561_c0_g1_i1.p1 TRINITY_DN36561_c0_g1~~TRINITY_DN36561_c0_g1_i1.p1  ORF type:complete len:1060 (+),score=265.68 TRINITY_DN36561_c0_g1_i1:78-3182(+)